MCLEHSSMRRSAAAVKVTAFVSSSVHYDLGLGVICENLTCEIIIFYFEPFKKTFFSVQMAKLRIECFSFLILV